MTRVELSKFIEAAAHLFNRALSDEENGCFHTERECKAMVARMFDVADELKADAGKSAHRLRELALARMSANMWGEPSQLCRCQAAQLPLMGRKTLDAIQGDLAACDGSPCGRSLRKTP